MSSDELLSTAEVGKRLGVTRQRVLELITEGRLPARKVGRAYIVRAGDVDTLEFHKVGRPPKAEAQITKKRGRKAA
jgi:excisionase family DNA binding protein